MAGYASRREPCDRCPASFRRRQHGAPLGGSSWPTTAGRRHTWRLSARFARRRTHGVCGGDSILNGCGSRSPRCWSPGTPISCSATRSCASSTSRGRGSGGDQVGVLETLVVDDEARGAGVGQALVVAARERLAESGVQVMKISVIAGNDDALRFYRREGAVDFLKTLVMTVSE
ncbi:GNAT family N-acetyltransferase [Streptomyces sp. NPDC101151]|uniref:GNAT family N-acetyltransferase n=1 Tax=Streptomyces sp. NPDC101151 TaxID=3366115 RepID=UPI0037F79E54